MSILQNAVDSIAIGLEDYTSSDHRRMVSSTRNIFAGILLLFKHKLCELSAEGSDEVLIKQKVMPSIDSTGALTWVGKGRKTVDVSNIEERFKSLGIEVDWPRIKKINNYRNDIEHYYSNLNGESVQQLISDSFMIIRDFISNELGRDPKKLLGDSNWKILVEVNEVYEKEKEESDRTLEQLNYLNDEILSAMQSYRCGECGSNLIEAVSPHGEAIQSRFRCRSCEHTLHYKNVIGLVLNQFYETSMYLAFSDGEEIPLIDCPCCNDGTYIFHENICASCGHSATHECERCGCNIPPSEIADSTICGYCSYMLEKLMAE